MFFLTPEESKIFFENIWMFYYFPVVLNFCLYFAEMKNSFKGDFYERIYFVMGYTFFSIIPFLNILTFIVSFFYTVITIIFENEYE